MNNIEIDIIHKGLGAFWVRYRLKNNPYKTIREVDKLHPRQVQSLIIRPKEVIW